MNAANEVAVRFFLQDKIGFMDIPRLIMQMIDEHPIIKNPSLDDVLEVDKRVKEETEKAIENLDK